MCRDHSREVVILRAGIILNAERYADGTWETRVRLTQNRELSVGQRDMRVRQIAMSDGMAVVRTPGPTGNGRDSQLVEDGAQSDHGVRDERRGGDRSAGCCVF